MPEGQFHKLHVATIIIEALNFLRQFMGAIAVLIILRLSQGKADSFDLWFVALGGLSIIPALFTYFTFRYGIVDGSLVVTKGLVFKQHRTIPLERIQNVQIRRTVVHRFLKVAAVDIETASGAGAEASLLAVGNAEADRLRMDLLHRVHVPAEGPLELPPLYRASLRNLLLAGATQNRALLIVAGIVGLFGFFQDAFDLNLPSVPNGLITQQMAVLFAILGFMVLFMAGWALSIAMTVVNYYGFTLKTASGGLQVRHGLFTQLERVIPVRRVQVLRVEAPALQRLLKVCHVFVVTASSFVDKSTGGPSPLCPLIDRSETDRFAQLIYPSLRLGEVQWQPVSHIAKRRIFVMGVLVWVALAFGVSRLAGPAVWWALLVLVPYQWWYANMWHKGQAWARWGNFLLSREGALGRSIKAVPLDRVQWVSITETPFQRRLGLGSVVVVTAGHGQGAALSIPYIGIEDASRIQNELSNSKHGRSLESGGL